MTMATEQQREAVAQSLWAKKLTEETQNSWRDSREYWFNAAPYIIAAYEAAAWVKAEDVPPSWFGRAGFIWSPGERVEETVIPRDLSRDPRHCGGYMFRPWPEPPTEIRRTEDEL
jgi:hypothetical protein